MNELDIAGQKYLVLKALYDRVMNGKAGRHVNTTTIRKNVDSIANNQIAGAILDTLVDENMVIRADGNRYAISVSGIAFIDGLKDRRLDQGASSIRSSSWTGNQFVLVDVEVIQQVRELARRLQSQIISMHFSSNSEAADLHGLANALVEVSTMAEPEVTILKRILASPKFQTYAALIGIVASIRGAIGI